MNIDDLFYFRSSGRDPVFRSGFTFTMLKRCQGDCAYNIGVSENPHFNTTVEIIF